MTTPELTVERVEGITDMTLLTAEQSAAIESLSQRERIEVVLNVLVRHLERQAHKKAFAVALAAVESSDTKQNAVAKLHHAQKASQP